MFNAKKHLVEGFKIAEDIVKTSTLDIDRKKNLINELNAAKTEAITDEEIDIESVGEYTVRLYVLSVISGLCETLGEIYELDAIFENFVN